MGKPKTCCSISVVIVLTMPVLTGTATLFAQEAQETQDERAEFSRRLLILVNARYEVPLRQASGVGILLPFGNPDIEDNYVLSYRGVLAEASVGVGGQRVALGLARRLKESTGPVLFGGDALVSLTRTGDSPRGATSDSTYLGAEAGLMLVAVRFSIGVAHRIRGLNGPKATIFTWSLGAQTGW